MPENSLIFFPGIRLLYKDFGSTNHLWNPIPDCIRREIPNGKVILAPSLSQLVWAVDAIILDHALTALGEALLTRKRIIVYDGGQPTSELVPPESKVLLRKRAIVGDTPDEFVNQVRSFLEAGDFSEVSEPDDEFLCAYGTYLNDGRSAERAAEVILEITRASKGQHEWGRIA